MTSLETLLGKIEDRSARVAVVGAGYVGLPLAVEAAQQGFETVAYDKAPDKVQAIAAGRSYVGDVLDADLAPLVAAGTLRATSDPVVLGSADAVVICVPTPLNKTKDPDVSLIMDAAAALLPHLHRGQLVVLESTTYPGFTREVLRPELERTGLRVGQDVFLAFSPERVDPGNRTHQTKNTPKVIAGMTPACRRAAVALYGTIIDTLVPVSSCDAAEMVKLLENTFRAVNIGLVNEVSLMCAKLGLDTWEVIEAAATKPFGFMPFFPGPGVGGHCIPVDPQYLSWKLKTLKYHARIVDVASEINAGMPLVVTQLVAHALNEHGKPLNGARVLVLGVAYKPDANDVRESPALDVIELLGQRKARVAYCDPHVPRLRVGEQELASVGLDDLASYDAVVIVTDHRAFDYGRICAAAQLVVDTRNATRLFRRDHGGKIFTL